MLYAATWLVAATAVFGSTRIIPIAGHLPGANGTAWRTDVSLTNNSTTASVVDLVFRPEDGVARTRTITLEAGQSMLLEDAVGPTQFSGANPASWLGQLEVRSTGDVSASAHIFTGGGEGGTFGSTYEGFDPSALSTSGALTGLVAGGVFRSNVAFANPSGQTAGFDYTVRREDGTVVVTRHLDLPAHSTRQISVGADVVVSTDGERLSLSWSANVPAYVVGSIIDNRSGDPTNAPSMSRDVTSLFFPVIGRTAGGNGTFWSTSAAVTSTADGSGNVTFAYRDSGTGQTYTKTVDIAAMGTVATDDVNTFVSAPAGSGSLTITSTTGIVGAVRVFNTRADGSTFGSAVLAQDDVVKAANVRIDGVRRDDDYRLNVAIANDDATAASGRVRLFDDRGREVEVEPFHVEHGRSIQVALNRTNDDVRAGEIEVETEHGVTVTVTASNVDNRTGDTIQRESHQENERQNDVEMKITPRVAKVGTPVLFSLKHAGSNVSSVTWDFGDGTTGTGAELTHTYDTAGEFNATVLFGLTGGATVRDREDVRVIGNGGGTTTPGTGAIDFTFSPAAPAVGEQVVFTATGATNGGFFKWKFPGNVRPIGNVVTFTFATAGSFEVELELEHGATNTEITRIVNVGGTGTGGGNNPGTGTGALNFTFAPTAPAVGQEVTFTAAGDTAGGVYKWKFPGDVRKFGPVVTFTFASAGSFQVEVEIEHGATKAEVTRIVNVGGSNGGGGNNPGTGTGPLNFTFSPSAPAVGQEVTFTASGDTAGGVYKWKFPGDVRKFGQVVTFTFTAAGSFEVEVEIEHGATEAEVRRVVTVGGGSNGGGGNNPGTGTGPLDFTFSPSAPAVGQEVTFTASGDTAGGTYKWKFPGDVRKFGQVVTFTFTTAGSFEVEVEIEHGATEAEVRRVVTVGGGSNGTPGGGAAVSSIDFSWTPEQIKAGQPVTFTATFDREPPAGSEIKWRLPNDSRPRGRSVTYTFPSAGSFRVEVEIEQPGRVSIERERHLTVVP
jgi:hypothetical protein